MEYICIGKIMTTHGLKGELKIRSDFKYKDQIFNVGNSIYIGNNYEKHEILSYRRHQDYDMVILSNISDIDVAIPYKQKLVYALKNSIEVLEDDYLNEDLIGLTAYYNNENIGEVIDVINQGNGNLTMKLDNGVFIPKNNNFILKVDLANKEIYLKNMEGLL